MKKTYGIGLIELLLYLSLVLLTFPSIHRLIIKMAFSQHQLIERMVTYFEFGYLENILRKDLMTSTSLYLLNSTHLLLKNQNHQTIEYLIKNKKLMRRVNGIGQYFLDEVYLNFYMQNSTILICTFSNQVDQLKICHASSLN